MSELGEVLNELAAKGLLARVTDIRAGDIAVTMLAAPAEQKQSDAMRERLDDEHHNETLFASA